MNILEAAFDLLFVSHPRRTRRLAWYRLLPFIVLLCLQDVFADDAVLELPERPEGPICEPMDYAEVFASALRFAIDPSASSESLMKLVEQRPAHFAGLMTALTLGGETRQSGDFSFNAMTIPDPINGPGLSAVTSDMLRMLDDPTVSAPDWSWLWERFLKIHENLSPEQSFGWACLRAEQAGEEFVEGLLGTGEKACRILEHVDGVARSRALAQSSELTYFSLRLVEGAEVRIGSTSLHAPLHVIDSLEFGNGLKPGQ